VRVVDGAQLARGLPGALDAGGSAGIPSVLRRASA
jgi:hypothetical protein